MEPSEEFTQVLRDWAGVFMHRSTRDFKRFMDDHGLSASQINALMHLYYQSWCGVSDIGGMLGVTNGAASQLVDRLVQQGLLARSEDASDRRVRQIQLTSKGRALIETGIEARRHWMQELTVALTPEQLSSISSALTMLTAAARRLEEAPPAVPTVGNS
jgi:DNA-binding MarR family transcriptional regulator